MIGREKIKNAYALLIFIILLAFNLEAAAQVSDFASRLKIHVNASEVYGDSDLTNFPVLVQFTHPDLRTTSDGGFVTNTNGYDIVLTASDGVTILNHQIENYSSNTSEGILTFWVRFPVLSTTTDTEFYIYFGNSLITSNPSTTSVWDSNYKMVLHLNEEQPADTYPDAAGEGTDALNNGSILSTGKISSGITFDNTSDRVLVEDNGTSPLDITGNISISFWLNIANLGSGPDLFTKGNYTNGYALWVDGTGRFRFHVNSSSLVSPSLLTNGVWTHATVTRASNGDRKIYVNGAQVAADNTNQSFQLDDEDFYLGTSNFWPYLGIMDEFRISNITRDSAWIATEYSNQNNPSTFIDQINAEPVVSEMETPNLTYNSGDSPLLLTSNISISDGDDTNLETAVIQITNNYESSEDILEFTDQLGITGSWDSINGILTLTGSTSLTNYENALRTITYRNTKAAPIENIKTIAFSVFDGDNFSNTQSRNVEVVKVNIPPELADVEETSILYFPNFGQVAITNNLTITDLDLNDLIGATIEISSGFVQSEDELSFVDENGIVGSWDSINGVLTLTGSASILKYINAIRSVVYENQNPTPTGTSRTLSISVNDGTENSNSVSRNIEFPTALTEIITYKPNDVFHFDAQDADGDGDLTIGQPPNGSLSIWGDRSDNTGGTSPDLSATASTGNEPSLNSNLLGLRSGIEFNGTNESYDLPSNAILNSSEYSEKSFVLVFRTGSNISGLQIIYEQGAATRGYNLSIKNSVLYAYVWNVSEWSVGNQYKVVNLGSVEANTTYTLIASHDATSSNLADRTWRANVNGGSIVAVANVDTQRTHGGSPEIGATDGSRDPETNARISSEGNFFDGTIAEIISWNSVLTDTDFTNIYAFSKNKWENVEPVLSGIEVTNLTFTEGDTPITTTSSLLIANDDSLVYDKSIDSAKVVIFSGYESTEDILNLPAAIGGITANFDIVTGTLTLSGNETIANYQQALRSVTYQNTNVVNPSETTRRLAFAVYDWDDRSNIVTRRIDIVSINSSPELNNIETTILAFTENDAPTDITSTLSTSDPDNLNLEGATIAFTNNFILGEDELHFDDQNGIIGTFDALNGVLSLSGTSSVTNYQDALRNVTFNNTSTDPVTNLNREATFRVFDGTDSSNVQSRTISVTNLNTPPTLSNIETSSLFYLASDTTIITENLALFDPDNLDIQSAVLQITSGYTNAEDSLIFEEIFGITDSWDDSNGILTLTGPASRIDFESALRTVKYLNTAETPTDSPREISFTVNDGSDNSNSLTRTVSFSIPKSVSGLLLWLKGDEGVEEANSDPAENGDNVLNWLDQSGNGHDFTSTGAIAPIYQSSVSTINSKPAIEFSGGSSNERLEDADAETQYLGGLSGLTIFFVIESDITSTDKGFWTTVTPNTTTNDRYFSLRYDAIGALGGASNVVTSGLRDLTGFSLESFEDAQTTEGQIVMLKWTTETTYEMYIDGVLSNPTSSTPIPSGTLDPSNLTTAILGQGPLDNNSSWDGLIAEVILYNNEISLPDQELIEDYLSNKYNVPIRLLTPALGGDAITADDANSVATFTTLSGPRVQESFAGEFSTGTYIFEAPSGFEWDDTGSNPTASVSPAFGGVPICQYRLLAELKPKSHLQ